MSDLVTHAAFVGAYGGQPLDWDPVLGTRSTRRSLRKAAGRKAMSALRTKPNAGPYFASLRITAAAELSAVQGALGTDNADTLETLLGLVVTKLWPDQQDLVPDLVAVSYGYIAAIRPDDHSAVIKEIRQFMDRIWSGATNAILLPAHAALVGEMMEAKHIDRAIASPGENPWQVPPPGWMPLIQKDTNPDRTEEAQEARVGTASSELEESRLSVLLGDDLDVEEAQTRDLCKLALHFGFTLADRLAGDIGIVPEGPWVERVVVVGFCAALPALADAFDDDELVSPPVLIDLARRVDRASGDGDLIQILATGSPETLLAEATVRIKATFNSHDIPVPDTALALFPIRLAASAEMARQAADPG